VGARSRSRRTRADRPDGQHLLRSAAVAAELVRDAAVGADDLVVEVGAGEGRLTAPLAGCAGHVIAVELDPAFTDRLRERFRRDPRVEVIRGDIRATALPDEPFRVFGNIPFGVTNDLLRRLLDDVSGPLLRADLIVQFEAARKRAEPWPSTALNLSWLPWWELALVRRIPRTGFEPPPSVDAAMLRITRRQPELLESAHRPVFVDLVRVAFDRPTWPLVRGLHGFVPPLAWKRFARARGLSTEAPPRHLDVWDWVALFRTLDDLGALSPRRRARRRNRPRSGGTRPRRS
jgi:23S rRNA (adenine-N6)-dimethyltransferase